MHTVTVPGRERRRGEPAVPDELDRLLTSAQRQALDQVTSFGWELAYVRHPLLEEPTIIVTPDGGQTHATITGDGELEFSPDLMVRH